MNDGVNISLFDTRIWCIVNEESIFERLFEFQRRTFNSLLNANPTVDDHLYVCAPSEVAMCSPFSRSPNLVFQLRGSVYDFPLRCFVGVYRKLHDTRELESASEYASDTIFNRTFCCGVSEDACEETIAPAAPPRTNRLRTWDKRTGIQHIVSCDIYAAIHTVLLSGFILLQNVVELKLGYFVHQLTSFPSHAFLRIRSAPS